MISSCLGAVAGQILCPGCSTTGCTQPGDNHKTARALIVRPTLRESVTFIMHMWWSHRMPAQQDLHFWGLSNGPTAHVLPTHGNMHRKASASQIYLNRQSNENLHVQQDVLLPEVWGGAHIRCTDFSGWNMGFLYWPNTQVLMRGKISRSVMHEYHKEFAAGMVLPSTLLQGVSCALKKEMFSAWLILADSSIRQALQL